MALNHRQQRLYVHTFDFYQPEDLAIDASGQAQDLRYPATPTYTGVKGYWQTKAEATGPNTIGRTNQDMQAITVDIFHFDIAQELGGNWAIKHTTPGHPDAGQWFITQGETMVKSWQANKQSVFAKRSTKPPGVA